MKEAEDALDEELRKGRCVLWIDNYNRNRYSKNPGIDRRLTLDCTAIAALPDIDIPFQGTFVGMLSLLDIVRRVQAVAQDISKAGGIF